MRAIPLHDYAECTAELRVSLESAIQPLNTLADVLVWVRGLVPPAAIVDIVTQDEYTHDVVVESTGRPYLVFDTS